MASGILEQKERNILDTPPVDSPKQQSLPLSQKKKKKQSPPIN